MYTFKHFLERAELPVPSGDRTTDFIGNRDVKMYPKNISQIKVPSINHELTYLITKHFDQVADIMNLNKPNSPELKEKTKDQISALMRQRPIVGTVATSSSEPDKVLGFMFYELLPDTLNIVKWGFLPGMVNSVAPSFLARLIEKLPNKNRYGITMSVRTDASFVAYKWLNKHGFEGKVDGDKYNFTYYSH